MAKNWYLEVLGSRLEKLYSLKATTDGNEIKKISDTVEILESLIFDGSFSRIEVNFEGLVSYEREKLASIEPYSSLFSLTK